MKVANVSEAKKKEVETLKELINKYKVVGIIDLSEMPSPQLQKMRKKLENGLIRVTKKRLIKIALEDLKESKKGIEKLEEEMGKDVMPCLILTNEDSFKLAKLLRKSKSNIAAKAGQIAPRDIVVKAGATSFTPGPIIGELGALGIKAAVENGKIAIKEDYVLVKEGEEINDKVADMLSKLGIEPMEVGLNLIVTYDNGEIFKKNVLDVDDKWYLDNIKLIASDGFKLAVGIGYVCEDTIEFLLKKGENEARVLEEFFKKSLTKNVDEERKKESGKKEVKVEEKVERKKVEVKEEKLEQPKVVEKKPEIKEEIKVEEKPKIKEKIEIEEKPGEDKIETLKKESFKKPNAQELINEVEEKIKEKKEDKIPSAAELAARQEKKKKKEPERVPTAAELAERKKEKEEGGKNE